MSGKKRKSAALLDYNTIKANAVANKSYLSEVREKIVAVNCVDIQRLLSGKLDLSEDEALQLLASKLSLTGLYNLVITVGFPSVVFLRHTMMYMK